MTSTESDKLKEDEKRFLVFVERGNIASVRRCLENVKITNLNINCCDPFGRSALIIAIENENLDLIHLLLQAGIDCKDALLHAIKEEFIEAVELLLQEEEKNHQAGEPYSWESINTAVATFTPDITPLILAAHINNYEIIKILLDRGATLPVPHDIKCSCDDCIVTSHEDSLRHSRARINAFRALASPSLIILSTKDPILAAFELSGELGRMSCLETEFYTDYQELQSQCNNFATALLDQVRTSYELEILLNYNTSQQVSDQNSEMCLERMELAIKYKQKQFVAHPNVQQLLASHWYDGVPGFRRKNFIGQLGVVTKLGLLYPFYAMAYIIAPDSNLGQFITKPFVKFICNSSSYLFFLFLLCLASQHVEHLIIEMFGSEAMQQELHIWVKQERGSLPGIVESLIVLWILSLIWAEIQEVWDSGLIDYLSDMWNLLDFISYSLFLSWISLKIVSWYQVQKELQQGNDPYYARDHWDDFDPVFISEGMFGAAMVFSFLKLVNIFSVNQHLGPLQISLGRIVYDIMKFFFIYVLVLFAFACGINQLLWYYAMWEKQKCYHLPGGLPDWDKEGDACVKWRRFANLFESSQSLFWASFGLIDLMNFELGTIKSYTRFWGLLMFGSYSVINIVVLLNLLIAMMSNSFTAIAERSDTEWKFARSALWLSYFKNGKIVPPPFNLIPHIRNIFGKKERLSTHSFKKKCPPGMEEVYQTVIKNIVRRYVTSEQQKHEEGHVTEDDVNEIKQDISTFRYELIDILKNNGMNTSVNEPLEKEVVGKKGRNKERRLMKGFTIDPILAIKDQRSSDKFWSIIMASKEGGIRHKTKSNTQISSSTHNDHIGSIRRNLSHQENSHNTTLDIEQINDIQSVSNADTPSTVSTPNKEYGKTLQLSTNHLVQNRWAKLSSQNLLDSHSGNSSFSSSRTLNNDDFSIEPTTISEESRERQDCFVQDLNFHNITNNSSDEFPSCKETQVIDTERKEGGNDSCEYHFQAFSIGSTQNSNITNDLRIGWL